MAGFLCPYSVSYDPMLPADLTPVEKSHLFPIPGRKESIMLCTVIDIRGDYAMVRYDDTGVESQVALFLLPFGVDVGDRLKFEDFEFTAL